MFSIFIKTFGCTLNQRDSLDIIKDISITYSEKLANIIIINTCGVKEQTEIKIYKYIRDNLKDLKNKEIIITGCLVDIDSSKLKELLPKAKMFGIKDKPKLLKYLDQYRIKKNNKEKLEISKIIIIANGCLGNCSYCAVKFARGKLKSKTIEQITKEIKEALANGTKEILLTAQDTGCYGVDINTNIGELLKEATLISGQFKIRLGMGNPQHFKNYKKEIVNAMKSEKMYKFLHVPLQSGNDEILRKMNRYYSVKEYLDLINYFKKNIKGLTVATDVIVGFPTETDKQFKDTLKIIEKCNFDMVNISRFGQRKNVEANNYKDLPGEIKKERSRITTELCFKIALKNNKTQIGKTKEIIIVEKGKNNTWMGRTNEYSAVIVSTPFKLGQITKCKIIDAKRGYLIGTVNLIKS
ncbi:MAG: tRNA (N(6)-L-threonylcarbamoyladenosine(37)-C(2))-methylthiotransferase [archaeon]|jgi:MiaB-like tRNA modifying enzyme